MPLYDNHFAGHMESGDPRTPLHGAAGCVWPTVPAMRYLLISDDATGVFLPFKTTGALVARTIVTLDHDLYGYVPLAWPPLWNCTKCQKVSDPSTGGYRWQIEFNAGSGVCSVSIDKAFPEQKCNVTVPLGNYTCPGQVPAGQTGTTFRMEQVEWDEATPP